MRHRVIALSPLWTALIWSACIPLAAQYDHWNDLSGRAAQLTNQGKYTDALPVALESLAVAESTFGKAHANYGLTLNAIGYLYLLMGRYSLAEENLTAAETTLRAALGPDSVQIITPTANLAQLYYSQASAESSPDRAAPYLAKAEQSARTNLAIAEKNFPANDLKLVPLLDQVATFCVVEKKFSDARLLTQRMLSIQVSTLPPEHAEIARTQEKIGFVNEALGDRRAAASAYQVALKISEKTLGAQDPVTARLRDSLQRVLPSSVKP
jgi:hypothetical protein